MGKTVFRSINEVKRHYFPNAYKEEQEKERLKDPAKYGTGLVKDLLDNLRKELRKQRVSDG